MKVGVIFAPQTNLSLNMLLRKPLLAFLCSIPFIIHAQPSIKLESKQVQLKSGKQFTLQVPQGYQITVAGEVEHRLRFMAKSPDGRLFATDMYNRGDNRLGRVIIFEQWNEQQKKFNKTTEYLTKLRNPNQVAFYSAAGQHFIYIAETGFIKRYKYAAGDNRPSDTGTIVARFPDYGLDYKYGGWHLTRSLTFHNNKLYVSIGSSCNACIEKEGIRACVLEMDPDGKNSRIFAKGLRNSVAIKWVNNQFWATSMGRDQIGPDKPEDLMHTIVKDGFYGWPYYYQYRKKVYPDPEFKDSIKPKGMQPPPVAQTGFKAHSAPLGFDYLTGFSDSSLNNSFLVALHGSTMVSRQRGNEVVQVMKDGSYRTIVGGFLQGKTEAQRYGRPCDVLQNSRNSFFVTDDKNGVLYYIYKP